MNKTDAFCEAVLEYDEGTVSHREDDEVTRFDLNGWLLMIAQAMTELRRVNNNLERKLQGYEEGEAPS